jgi:dihydrofolate synthase/folylpolyglutamate synthase
MDYQQTLDFLYGQLPMFQRVGAAALKFNLDNITKLMDALGNPHLKVRTVHVAGTNGKGSSSHMLASVLQESGYKTGLHTSPHLKSFTERIRINGQEIDDDTVVSFVRTAMPLIEEIKPSFFEITFAMAMHYFADMKVDVAIIEVGMGGRLDSTNIIYPQICLITNISMDHQQFLGNTLAEIAGEKAGIMKAGVPTVIGQTQPEIQHVFEEKAESVGAKLLFADTEYYVEQAADNRVNVVKKDVGIKYEGIQLDLKGAYQITNLIGVIAVLDELQSLGYGNINDAAVAAGLAKVVGNTGLKGRWQITREQPLVIADTGHNLAGVAYNMNQLASLDFNHLHIVWGMVQDKDPNEILKLLPKTATYYFVQAKVPRAMDVHKLKTLAATMELIGQEYDSVNTGYEDAMNKATKEDLVFVGGSTFVVAELEDL